MQRGVDSKIQARVRILLARRWIDLRSVTVGTTNGVVYIGGTLRPVGSSGSSREEPSGPTGSWLKRIQKEISEIPEVRDVVFQLQDSNGMGEGWQRESA